MACLCGDTHEDAVMSYDTFIYVLLRTAADNDGSFRTAFQANPESTLALANHEIALENLGSETLTLPSQEDAQALLANYLPDYDGTRTSPMNIRFNWSIQSTSS